MATTTNYSWTTPDDTDLVKDGAAAIRTLGSSVDTTTKALNPSTTLGDIEYRSSTANTNTRLGIGTTGQVLGVSSGVPAWITHRASGTTIVSTDQSTTSSSYTDLATVGPSVTLTTGTKVLVIFSTNVYTGANNTNATIDFDISGATSRSATDETALKFPANSSAGFMRMTGVARPTVTAGSNTFTMKYKSAAGTQINFFYREMTIIDLGS
jgi:hypothetical protein